MIKVEELIFILVSFAGFFVWGALYGFVVYMVFGAGNNSFLSSTLSVIVGSTAYIALHLILFLITKKRKFLFTTIFLCVFVLTVALLSPQY